MRGIKQRDGRGWQWWEVYKVVVLSIWLIICGGVLLASVVTMCIVLLDLFGIISAGQPPWGIAVILPMVAIISVAFLLMLKFLRNTLADIRSKHRGEK
jgi:hypothetical protein